MSPRIDQGALVRLQLSLLEGVVDSDRVVVARGLTSTGEDVPEIEDVRVVYDPAELDEMAVAPFARLLTRAVLA